MLDLLDSPETAVAPLSDKRWTIGRQDLEILFDALQARGYQLVGPTLRNGVVLYGELTSVDDLPVGWGDEQRGGTYRVQRRSDEALFGYTLSPHAWKRYLHPPRLRLWQARRTEDGFTIEPDEDEAPKLALIGVRACELYAIQIQDRVFLEGPYVDTSYRRRREHAFIVAVNCGQASGSCFCASLGTGPKVPAGFDLALTEIVEPGRHLFVVEVGSERGAEILDALPHRPASAEEAERAETIVAETAANMGRTLNRAGVRELLYRNFEHPRWEATAERCLACGNCTLVCPTCFCTTIEDVTDLTGQTAEHWRRDDSCFTLGFSFISSGAVRVSTKARYRQWLTHKLAAWVDQFGVSGCVGCGRCITWCPVGIDLTEEVAALRAGEEAMQRG